jgi:hypothetical protein
MDTVDEDEAGAAERELAMGEQRRRTIFAALGVITGTLLGLATRRTMAWGFAVACASAALYEGWKWIRLRRGGPVGDAEGGRPEGGHRSRAFSLEAGTPADVEVSWVPSTAPRAMFGFVVWLPAWKSVRVVYQGREIASWPLLEDEESVLLPDRSVLTVTLEPHFVRYRRLVVQRDGIPLTETRRIAP